MVIDGWGISCVITLRESTLDITRGESTLVQVMVWCPQAENYWMSQCWPRLYRLMDSQGHRRLRYKSSSCMSIWFCAYRVHSGHYIAILVPHIISMTTKYHHIIMFEAVTGLHPRRCIRYKSKMHCRGDIYPKWHIYSIIIWDTYM